MIDKFLKKKWRPNFGPFEMPLRDKMKIRNSFDAPRKPSPQVKGTRGNFELFLPASVNQFV